VRLIPLLGMSLHITSIPERGTILLERSMLLLDRDTADVFGIPESFECDGESIPVILPETAAGDAAGVPHDFMYRFAFIYRWNPRGGRWEKFPVSRAWADEFYRATAIAYTGWTWWARVKWAVLRFSGVPFALWKRSRGMARVWPGPEPEVPPSAAGGAS
jgi:hypothetical protein